MIYLIELVSFQSNNDNDFSPQWAAKSDLSTDLFLTPPTSNTRSFSLSSMTFSPPLYRYSTPISPHHHPYHPTFTLMTQSKRFSNTQHFLCNPAVDFSFTVITLSSISSSLYKDASPICSQLTSTIEDIPIPTTHNQLHHDLDEFIRPQQQIHSINEQLTKSQLTHSASPAENSRSSICNIPAQSI